MEYQEMSQPADFDTEPDPWQQAVWRVLHSRDPTVMQEWEACSEIAKVIDALVCSDRCVMTTTACRTHWRAGEVRVERYPSPCPGIGQHSEWTHSALVIAVENANSGRRELLALPDSLAYLPSRCGLQTDRAVFHLALRPAPAAIQFDHAADGLMQVSGSLLFADAELDVDWLLGHDVDPNNRMALRDVVRGMPTDLDRFLAEQVARFPADVPEAIVPEVERALCRVWQSLVDQAQGVGERVIDEQRTLLAYARHRTFQDQATIRKERKGLADEVAALRSAALDARLRLDALSRENERLAIELRRLSPNR